MREDLLDDVRLGGSLPFWVVVGLIGMVLVGWGVIEAPATTGFLLLIAGGLLLGISYGQLLLRMPSLTGRASIGALFALFMTLLLVGVVAFAAARAPTPEPDPSALLAPPR